jgi:hypothetical protein
MAAIAQGWQSLVRSRQPDDDAFETRTKALGTGQEASKEAH